MCKEPTPWEKSVQFHGHVCPGLIKGFKVALIALRELGITRAQDEELFAIVENDACGVDAVQVVTGCTLGKGNLLFRDYGKQVYTFGNRRNGEAVRISLKRGKVVKSQAYKDAQAKAKSAGATDEEKDYYNELHSQYCQQLMDLSDEDFCDIKKVEVEFPSKARLFDTVICQECGEGVMEPRLRVKEGKLVCLSCAGGSYTRGW